jgi:hypothetical protein
MHKVLASIGVCILAGAIAVAAQQSAAPSASFPGAVPISQEHHHHLIVDNGYISAYDVEVDTHDATLMHIHDKDYVYVVFGEADITNAVQGKQVVSQHVPNLATTFVHGGFAHIAADVGTTPFRNVTISLKHPQGNEQTYFPSVDAALQDTNRSTNREGGKDILETDELRMCTVKIGANKSWAPPKSDHPRFIIKAELMDDPARAKENTAPGFPVGLLEFVDSGKTGGWSLRNNNARPFKVVWLDFKD